MIGATRDAGLALENTEPVDASLVLAKRYLSSMFVEYARAVQAREHGRNPDGHMYRSYFLDGEATSVLQQAQPGLAKLGCDVSALL